ncbi:peptidoglycan-binding protein LysM [Cochlodiniinecator piscidefendens]|uniref:peptidoglycan-binding protein LysM n=1 Tax=Cochlodiniinecator piscidefendens TaxID=2715756 RepID=UPI00140BDE91|nr:peptidoglycan-binding protein LysM [Cochlodiniinecator piscidefendens]
MGLWSFMKDTGKSLFGGDDTPNEEALKQEITDLGLEAEGVDISVEGDQVKISGKGLSAEAQEKVILAVGNVAGVASVESDIKDEPNFHTVEKGDTLSAVAKKTLGNANRYHEIFEANKPMLSHPDKIYPGQVLRIPTK